MSLKSGFAGAVFAHRTGLARVLAVLALLVCLPRLSVAAEPIVKWAGMEKDVHPRLYITPQDVTRMKSSHPDLINRAKAAKAWKFGDHGEGDLLIAALLVGDEAAQRQVAQEALEQMDVFIKNIPRTPVQGPNDYGHYFARAIGSADVALGCPLTTPEQRNALLGKLAQAATMVNNPAWWDKNSKINLILCPNLSTLAFYFRMATAAMIPSHPNAKVWFKAAWTEIQEDLDGLIDPAGGMNETPHYSALQFDYYLGACLIARNAGEPDQGRLFDSRLAASIRWLANISTPRDVRNNGTRRLPSVGHTYANESSSNFGIFASLWKDHDPQLAAEMQWMDLEHGSPLLPGIHSYYPALMGFRAFLKGSAPAPQTPRLASTCYPETGVLLRNTIGGGRETTLYLIAGRNHSHYYNDSGSITLWGKGREFLNEDAYADGKGNEERRHDSTRIKAIDARSVHSMPDGPAVYNCEGVMAIRNFSASPLLDYVRGTRAGWQRMIAFAKDANPLGPNYFVISDSFNADSVPTDWRLFLLANQISVQGNRATVVGKDDVDLDIIAVRPEGLKLEVRNDHLFASLDKPGTITVVIFPRLKTEASPQVAAIEGGRGVKVSAGGGADYIFLDPEVFKYSGEGVNFEGRVGLVRVRSGQSISSIPGASEVAPGWEGGDREIRSIPWDGEQFPAFPYDFMKSPPDR